MRKILLVAALGIMVGAGFTVQANVRAKEAAAVRRAPATQGVTLMAGSTLRSGGGWGSSTTPYVLAQG